jgi:hypothetical protein
MSSNLTDVTLFKPFPGFQTFALAYEEIDEKLISGGRGSGKTSVALAWLVHPTYINNPLYRGLVIRRQATDLVDFIDRARQMYSPLGATFASNPPEITFPSGAIIRMGHLNDDDAYQKYQGQQYSRMLIEEATHIPSEALYEKLIASCRSTVPGLTPRILLTSNPDGPGRHWLKRRFQIVSFKHKLTTRKITAADGTTLTRTLLYMHSTVADNPALAKDPSYQSFLASITDPELRQAWQLGDWDAIGYKGSYYGDLISALRKQGHISTVPYDPSSPVDTFWDLGIGDDTSIVFVQYVGREPHVIDYYSTNGESLDHYVKVLRSKDYLYGTWYIPHDGAQRELGTGRSRLEMLEGLAPSGVSVEVCPRLSVDDGINAVRMFLPQCWFDAERCSQLIESLELYSKEWDDKNGMFKEKPKHDHTSHAADAFRLAALHASPTSSLSSTPSAPPYTPPAWL